MPTNAEPTFPVCLTSAQRLVVAELRPGLAPRLQLDKNGSRTIRFTINELDQIQHEARPTVLSRAGGMKRNSLRHVMDAATDAITRFQGFGAIPVSQRVFQIKITLTSVAPPIWRRIKIKDCTLDRLHHHIQLAMGWQNCHLHEFQIYGKRYGDPSLLDDGSEDFKIDDSTVARLSNVIAKDDAPMRFGYEYDFGDGWHHEFVVENCLHAQTGERYPVCVDGARACPPEDIGGACGYAEYLEAMADPTHEQHHECVLWRGPFDPAAFDPARVTKQMRRGMPKPALDA